mgnify:CR=1 FL=1
MDTHESRRRHFLEETFRLLGSTLGGSRLTFYLVDDERNLHNFVCSHVPAEFLRRYIRDMHRVDPLHIRRIEARCGRVAGIEEADAWAPAGDIDDYRRFLRRYDIVDNIELVFRQEGRIRAGISVMWSAGDRPRGAHTQALADDLQRYIEFNVAGHLAAPRSDPRREAMRLFHLTPREAEVAKLLCAGCTNADVAACLGIGLATVKTHVLHIFEKTGVENRAGLVARLSSLG